MTTLSQPAERRERIETLTNQLTMQMAAPKPNWRLRRVISEELLVLVAGENHDIVMALC